MKLGEKRQDARQSPHSGRANASRANILPASTSVSVEDVQKSPKHWRRLMEHELTVAPLLGRGPSRLAATETGISSGQTDGGVSMLLTPRQCHLLRRLHSNAFKRLLNILFRPHCRSRLPVQPRDNNDLPRSVRFLIYVKDRGDLSAGRGVPIALCVGKASDGPGPEH